ncbi:MAG TPA: DUF2332 family protein [Anaeromyxobacter sp.]|nr:DUF2332 family protein [Anaeromyxobacter sp.]
MKEPRSGTVGLADELARERQLLVNGPGRSPPYARALELLPSVLAGPAGRLVEAAWRQRRFFAWYERPLLLLAALRNDALAEGEAHPLWAAFASPDPSADAVTADALRAALDGSRERVLDALAHRAVQTNETSRAVAWLWPAALAGASGGARPVALADVGASAGLNLVADGLPPIWTDEDGAPLDVAQRVQAWSRLGLDESPLDVGRAEDARWLRACVWPGEREREERLLLAIEAFRAARIRPDAPVLVPIGATNVPARLGLLSAADAGALVIAYQTVLRDYLAPEEHAEYAHGMRAWLATRPPGQALWIEMEFLERGDLPAVILAHVRAPGGALRSLALGRCGSHPRSVQRSRDAEAELRELLAASSHAAAGA